MATAALCGRLYRFDLASRATSAKAFEIPLPFPWAVIPKSGAPAKAPSKGTPTEPVEKKPE